MQYLGICYWTISRFKAQSIEQLKYYRHDWRKTDQSYCYWIVNDFMKIWSITEKMRCLLAKFGIIFQFFVGDFIEGIVNLTLISFFPAKNLINPLLMNWDFYNNSLQISLKWDLKKGFVSCLCCFRLWVLERKTKY